MTYTFKFGQDWKLVLVMILPALVGLIPFILGIELLPIYFPQNDWTIILLTLAYTSLVIFSTYKGVKSARADVELIFNKNNIQFTFPVKNIFHKNDFELEISNILITREDNDKGMDFLYIKTKKTLYSDFHLMDKEDTPEFIEFKNQLYGAINNFKN